MPKEIFIDSLRIMKHQGKDYLHLNERICNRKNFLFQRKNLFGMFLVTEWMLTIEDMIHYQDLILVDLRMIQPLAISHYLT